MAEMGAYAGLARDELVRRLAKFEHLVVIWGEQGHGRGDDDGDERHAIERLTEVVRGMHVDLRNIAGELLEGIKNLTTDQGKLDADIQALTDAQAATSTALTGVGGHLDALAAEVAALKVANPALDLTKADEAVAAAKAGLAQAQALAAQAVADDPDNPAPTPTPTPTP